MDLMCLRLLLFLCLAAANDMLAVVSLEENILPVLPVIVLGVLCDFFFCISFSACLQPR
jgi:hypothetical protein